MRAMSEALITGGLGGSPLQAARPTLSTRAMPSTSSLRQAVITLPMEARRVEGNEATAMAGGVPAGHTDRWYRRAVARTGAL